MKLRSLNKAFEWIEKRKTILAIFIVSTLLVVLLCSIIYITFKDYRKTIVEQQQQQLLTIANSISRSIELFIGEKSDNLRIIANNPEFENIDKHAKRGGISEAITYTLKVFYETQKNNVDSVYLVNSLGEEVFEFPSGRKICETDINGNKENGIDYVIKEKEAYIGDVCTSQSGQLLLNIYMPILRGNELIGVLVSAIKIDTMDDYIVRPVRAGEKGYAMVKDQHGYILMHPVKEQKGIDVINTRKERYPDLDFSELEKLIDKQMSGEEGTAIYHSYWWQDNVLEKAKKISGFAPVHIRDYFWVVAVTMSYDEVVEPIQETLNRTILMALVIIILISIVVFLIVRIQKNKEALEIETKYLKELNSASEELRRRDAQLQHSEKLQMIGSLTGGIAHEFNNLLTPILGYSESLLGRLKEKNDVYEDIEVIFDSSIRAKELIEQILILSRNDNGISKFKPINVNNMLKETLKLVKSVLPADISIDENIGTDCGYIFANNAQMHQVIFNLCTNAYHSMRHSGGTLKISAALIEKDEAREIKGLDMSEEKHIQITIADTGCGMTEETMSKIFDPFFTTKPAGEGTGLGLFIVQGIISKHRGAITVQSKVGEGSCFNVYLPQIHEKPQAEKMEKEEILSGKGTILLVDDKQKIVNMLKKELERVGYNVVGETSSIKALKVFEENPQRFDLVITDMIMPHIKGTELAERLKQIRYDIKIILITGFLEDIVLKYKEKLIIDDYMVKPIFSVKLCRLIGEILSKR